MKRYYICADVHSYYTELKKALDKCGFDKNNKDHVFVSCGDLLDRGDESKECLDFVNSLPNEQKILICGNHEDLLFEAIKRGCFYSYDYHNGTVKTCMDLCNKKYIDDINVLNDVVTKIAYNKDLEKYYDSLKNYAEIGDFICVHGWLPLTDSEKNVKRDIAKCHTKEWEKARWHNGMDMWYHKIRPKKEKTVICGHWHASFGNYIYHYKGSGEFEDGSDFTPFIDRGIIALDSCVAHTRFLNCVVIEDNKLIIVNGENV